MKLLLSLITSLVLVSTPSFASITDIQWELDAVKLVKLRAGERGTPDSFFDHFKFTSSWSSKLRDIQRDIMAKVDDNGDDRIDTAEEYEKFTEIYAEELQVADFNRDGLIKYEDVFHLSMTENNDEDIWCTSFNNLGEIVKDSNLLNRLIAHCNGLAE